MSTTVGTPYNNREEKLKGRASSASDNKQCQTRPKLSGKLRANSTVFSRLLNVGSDDKGGDFSRQSVPRTGRGHGKGAVTDGGQTCRGDDECGCRRRTQATPRVEVGHALKIVGEVRRGLPVKTAIDKDCQLVLNPLSHLQPIQVSCRIFMSNRKRGTTRKQRTE